MSDSSATLGFLIDSPMMSWGSSSRFNRRETDAFPTKSAIVGLLAAALGIDKHADDEAERLAPLAALRFTVLRIPRPAAPMPMRLSDFHTVGGGYVAKNSVFERMSIPRKASGGASANAVITHRTYLTEARFIALLDGPQVFLETLAAALLDPVWGIWFGRKTCLPAFPLGPVVASSHQAAVNSILKNPGIAPPELTTFEGVTEDDGPDAWHPADQPHSFGAHHGPVPAPYQSRPVRHHRQNLT